MKRLYVTRDESGHDGEYAVWEADGRVIPYMCDDGLWRNPSRVEERPLLKLFLLPQIKALNLVKGGITEIRLDVVVVERNKKK